MTSPLPFRRPKSIDERFWAFHAANPQVFDLFMRYVGQLRSAGRTRYSADAVMHRIRWHLAVEVRATEPGPKLNDHYTRRYARLAAATDPTLLGFFETRRLRSGAA
jgi:hypothetical protein